MIMMQQRNHHIYNILVKQTSLQWKISLPIILWTLSPLKNGMNRIAILVAVHTNNTQHSGVDIFLVSKHQCAGKSMLMNLNLFAQGRLLAKILGKILGFLAHYHCMYG